jgi:uncharacterized protein YcbK (DUF882 family)
MGDLSPHFDRAEFACGDGCGFDSFDAGTLKVLEQVRKHFGMPVMINSGCRCAAHNAAVGGSEGSLHLQARAADIVVEGVSPHEVASWLNKGPLAGRGGLGKYETFTHVDTRSGPPARWTG